MSDRDVKLTLLHTNDIHSHFEEASRVAGYVADVRRRVGDERLLLLDCGDFLDRVALETEGTQGLVNRALLERMRYDAVLIGNNEGLTLTVEQLDELYRDFPIPVVCANMLLQATGQPPAWMTPTWTTVKAGVRIGVIGLTAVFNDYYRLLGWEALDPIAVARAHAERLRPDVDVLIVLSHLGLRADEQLAAQVAGIDLVLGGHTHHLLESPLRVGETAIGAAGKFGQYVGHLELTVRRADERGGANARLEVSGGSLSTDGFARDEETDRIVAAYGERAIAFMDRPVARLAAPLTAEPYGESPLPTLLAEAVRRETGAEIGLVNAGQLLGGLPAGDVTARTIHALCPSPINPCLIKLTGKQLLRTLEQSLLPEFYEMEIRGFGFRGKVLGTLCVDGMALAIDDTRPPYERIVSATVGGEPLRPERVYEIGTLDMFTFGVGYLTLKEGTDVRYFLPDFIRDVLASALRDERLVADCARPRRTTARRA